MLINGGMFILVLRRTLQIVNEDREDVRYKILMSFLTEIL